MKLEGGLDWRSTILLVSSSFEKVTRALNGGGGQLAVKDTDERITQQWEGKAGNRVETRLTGKKFICG